MGLLERKLKDYFSRGRSFYLALMPLLVAAGQAETTFGGRDQSPPLREISSDGKLRWLQSW